MLLLAVDANFRLKNRMRANEIDDPPLGPGWGYWVEPTKYREHLKNYVHKKDVSQLVRARDRLMDFNAGQHLHRIHCAPPEGYTTNYGAARVWGGWRHLRQTRMHAAKRAR
jgi:hypothetical protein